MSDEEEHSESEFYYPEEPQVDNEDENTAPNSQEQIDNFITSKKAQNTIRKTKSDMNILHKYFNSIGKTNTEIESLPANELDHLLSKFFMEVKKADGTNYEPNTVSSFQRSIQRYLEEKGSQLNIFKDKEFQKSRMVLVAKRKSLVEDGKGNKPQATKSLTDADEDKFFSTGQFGDYSPEVLQRTIWWFLSLHFGFRARDESRKLCWGDVQLQTTSNGEEMLVWLNERGTKTRTGQEKGHQRAFQPKIYATGGERCPLKYYKMYAAHRPTQMNAPDSPFFLAVKHNRATNDPVWYKKSPLGKNQIGKFLSVAAENAGIHKGKGAKVSNHSVRKTSISRLLDANIPENFVAQLSGHKSTESLKSYKTAGEQHQKTMSLTLSRSVSKELMPVPAASVHSSINFQSTAAIPNTSVARSDQPINPQQFAAQSAAMTKDSDVSAFFSGVHSVSGCSFQIFNGPVTFQQEKRRRIIIESDDEG